MRYSAFLEKQFSYSNYIAKGKPMIVTLTDQGIMEVVIQPTPISVEGYTIGSVLSGKSNQKILDAIRTHVLHEMTAPAVSDQELFQIAHAALSGNTTATLSRAKAEYEHYAKENELSYDVKRYALQLFVAQGEAEKETA